MSDVTISKVNEVYAKISCDRGIAKELSEHFTFFVPGYKFQPAFKNKIWDGKIRLYNLQTRQLYLGLIKYVEEFCDERQYTFEYDSSGADLEDQFSQYHAKKFIDSLSLCDGYGESLMAHDYQIDSFVHGMQSKRTLLVSPTSSGKSLMIYLFVRQFLDYQKLKGLIIVPTTSLVEQLTSDFKDYSLKNGFDVDRCVNKIYGFQGADKYSDKPVTITTWQSIYKLPKEWFEQFDFVIGDEAHQFKSDSLVGALTKCTNTKYRIGTTGTLDGTKTNKLVLEGLFGLVKNVITTKQLMDNGQVTPLTIKCIILKHSDEISELIKKNDDSYKEEVQYLIRNKERNKFIRNLAISLDKNTLILYQMVDKHGKVLYNIIRETEKLGNRKVFFVNGSTETEDREQLRRIMEEETNAIIVASYGTFSTGINIKNLHNIIFASPYKSRIKVLQSIGRVLRKGKNKDEAVLYDIADDMRVGNHMNSTLRHFVERVKIYTNEKFPFKIYKIGLKNE